MIFHILGEYTFYCIGRSPWNSIQTAVVNNLGCARDSIGNIIKRIVNQHIVGEQHASRIQRVDAPFVGPLHLLCVLARVVNDEVNGVKICQDIPQNVDEIVHVALMTVLDPEFPESDLASLPLVGDMPPVKPAASRRSLTADSNNDLSIAYTSVLPSEPAFSTPVSRYAVDMPLATPISRTVSGSSNRVRGYSVSLLNRIPPMP